MQTINGYDAKVSHSGDGREIYVEFGFSGNQLFRFTFGPGEFARFASLADEVDQDARVVRRQIAIKSMSEGKK